jgi:hypothetical protein
MYFRGRIGGDWRDLRIPTRGGGGGIHHETSREVSNVCRFDFVGSGSFISGTRAGIRRSAQWDRASAKMRGPGESENSVVHDGDHQG